MSMWSGIEIVSLDRAKAAAKITDTVNDEDLLVKLEEAHGFVLDFVHRPNADWVAEMLTWDDETAPVAIRSGITAMFVYLTRFAGDDDQSPKRDYARDLPSEVAWRLSRYRDPPLA